MDSKKLLYGTVAGTIGGFAASFLVFGLALANFMAENTSSKEPIEFHWLIIGHVVIAFLLSYIFCQWAQIKTFSSGLKAGALIAFLSVLGADLIFLGTSQLFTGGIVAVIVDALGASIAWAVGGGAIGWALGKSES